METKKATPLDPEYEIIPEGMEAQQLPSTAIAEIKAEHHDLTTQLRELRVTNEEAYKNAAELVTRAKSKFNNIETFRKAITGPLKAQIKVIDDMFKRLSSPFEMIEDNLKAKMVKYLDSRKNTANVEVRHTETGRTTTSTVMDYEVTDADKIERKYLTVDLTAIGRDVRGRLYKPGNYPGFRVFERTVISAGTKK